LSEPRRHALLTRHAPDAEVTHARTQADLLRDVASVADTLAPSEREGEEVLVLCHDRYHFAVALLAAWHRGLVVALPPSTQPEMVRSLRQRSTVRTVLHDVEGALGVDVRGLLGRDVLPASLMPIPSERHVVVVYTSGTTGAPLACPKTAGQLLGEAEVLARTFEIGGADRVLATVPPHHIYGLLFGLLVPLVGGASFVRETHLHAEPLAALWRAEQPTVLVSVPAHLRALVVLDREQLERPPRHVFSSGAALPDATSSMLFERFGWRVTEVLGSSETGGIAHRTAVIEVGASPPPFVALEGVRVACAPDGRMLVDSPFLDPDLPRPFVSADRIAPIDERRFAHLGRADGVVKVGGTRVSIQEIEARLLAIAGVTDAVVWAVPVGGARGHETRAVVAGRSPDGALLTHDGIRHQLLQWLEPVVVPRRIRVVDALPREPTGKLRRDALEALFSPA
jgi:acyl-coenzyme A synthetase/AMP-(fatty) acid ligase